MKILQIIDSLNVGGAERVYVDLSNLLFKNKVDVTCLVYKQNGSLKELLHKDLPKLDLKRENKYSLAFAYKLSKVFSKYNILHVHLRHNYRYVKLICFFFNVKTNVVLHDHYGSIEIDKHIPSFFKSFLKTKYYIGVDRKLINWAIDKLEVKKDATFLLRNIVLKENIKAVKNRKGIVIVGNIKPIKNQLFAIQLLPFLNENLTIIGNIHDKVYYDIMVKEVENLSLENRVFFLHNVVNAQEKLSEFSYALCTSKSESGPLILAEYLAQSLPFVAYKTGGISEVLEQELPECFLHSFDIKLWVNQINKLSLKPNKRFEELFNKYFSSDDYVTECINIYQKIINS